MTQKELIVFFVASSQQMKECYMCDDYHSYTLGVLNEQKNIENEIDNLLMDNKYLNHPNLDLVFINYTIHEDLVERIANLYNARYITRDY